MMWILNQAHDRLINLDNVTQIRVMEDGELLADGKPLGKYKNPDPVMGNIVSSISMNTATILIMGEDTDDA